MADETEIKFRFTAKGQQVSAAILGGKDKIEFTKAAASIDVHTNDTDADVANIIDLDNKKQIVDIHDVVAVKNNIVQIPIKFEKNKITEDYQMNTIGIYARYQDQEFLYAFGALKYPIYMHHTDDSGVFKMYTYITVGTVANVVIKTDNTESVSRDDLRKILVDYPTKSDIAGKANVSDVYNKDEIDDKFKKQNTITDKLTSDISKKVSSVNGILPDSLGNVILPDLSHCDPLNEDTLDLDTLNVSGDKKAFRFITQHLKASLSPDNALSYIGDPNEGGMGYIINYRSAYEVCSPCSLQILILTTGNYYECRYDIYFRLFSKQRIGDCGDNIFYKIATDNELDKKIDLKANIADVYKKSEVYNKTEINEKIDQAGKLKTVNGQAPDGYGNVTIKIPSDYVKTVNGQTPDYSGNVSVPTYAPNLLKGTSEQPQNIPPNTSTDVIHLTTFSNTKYTVAVDIDYGAFSTGAAGCKLQINNGGTVIVSPIIKAGSKGRASVTFTTPTDCSWIAILLNSNSSYIGKYSNLKACQWQDNDTPPDMTWVPAIEDYRADYAALSEKVDVGDNIEAIGRKLADKANVSDVYSKSQADSKFGGAIKKIDGYSPDSSGNMNLGNTYATINSVNKKANTSDIYTQSQIDQKLYFKANTYDVYNRDEIDDKLNKKISGFSNPDYVFGSSSTIDVDGVASGVFALNGCSLKASKGGSYVFTNVDLATYNWGYLVVSNYNGFTGGYHVGACVEYLVLLGTYNDVVGVYIRSFSPNDSYYNNVFKKLTN